MIPVAARWIEPNQRQEPLSAYAREAERRTLALLDESLDSPPSAPNEVIRQRLLNSAARDIEELRPQLEPRAEEFADIAKDRLTQRGEREAQELRQTLEAQRERVAKELERHEAEFRQLSLEFDANETRQLQADVSHWRTRLTQFDQDIDSEPERIRAFYKVRAQRVEPVGLVYLWPETN